MLDTYPAIVVDSLKLVYVPVAKSASSSIKLALRRELKLGEPEPWWTIHKTVWPRTCTPTTVPERYHVFSCVRNPWDRLYSCWRSKFHPDRFKDLANHHNVLRIDMTFPEFVEALKKIDLEVANDHLCPQSTLLRPWKCDTIFRVESLLDSIFGISLPKVNTTGEASVYDAHTAKTVRDLYRGDLVYGYHNYNPPNI